MLTIDRLKQVLFYDPTTGHFTWAMSNKKRAIEGQLAGSINSKGYIAIGIDKRVYLAHRLAWLITYGEWPLLELDHANGNRIDNRIENLREATRSQNKANSRRRYDNASGFKGAYYNRPSGKWQAQIVHLGKCRSLGYYSTPEAAHEAYMRAAREAFGEFARAS